MVGFSGTGNVGTWRRDINFLDHGVDNQEPLVKSVKSSSMGTRVVISGLRVGTVSSLPGVVSFSPDDECTPFTDFIICVIYVRSL